MTAQITRLTRLSRRTKGLIMMALDLLMLPLALWSAFALRLGDITPTVDRGLLLFLLLPLISIPIFLRLGLYRAVIRYFALRAAYVTLLGVSLSTLMLAAIVILGQFSGVPRSSFFIYWATAFIYLAGSRFLLRNYLQQLQHSDISDREPVAIYGAGSSGALLAESLAKDSAYQPVAFVDDKRGLHGGTVNGIRVFPPTELDRLVEQLNVRQVLLAVPAASRARRQEILTSLERIDVHVRTVPSYNELIQGKAKVHELREITLEDLLGRDPIPPDQTLLGACITKKAVMVTGAGGSIGSELCRQILLLRPHTLVLFEISEYALYSIERELRDLAAANSITATIVPMLGSVTRRRRVQTVMESFQIDTLYHAAAYKHVPMVEYNMIEGVQNNVIGTWRTAEAAIAAKVSTFVLISTDKAVRPTNVMGASKRLAELVCQGLHLRQSATRFCMVRFGNVLGSSGSVVPLFQQQICQGGPVTVTHPEITRYFMTIPEAAQLVIQAGSLGSGGDVFVLDMGESVRIADMARSMIRLMGRDLRDDAHPNGIAIEFSGLRPGEKLYEELLIGDDATLTQHPRILRAEELSLPRDALEPVLEQVMDLSRSCDCAALRTLLLHTVQGYQPSDDIADLIWRRRQQEPPRILGPDSELDPAPAYVPGSRTAYPQEADTLISSRPIAGLPALQSPLSHVSGAAL